MVTENTKVCILLRVKLSDSETVDLLKPREVRQIIDLIYREKAQMSDLTGQDSKNLLLKIEKELGLKENRLYSLLNRGISLGLKLDEWSKRGITIISIFESEYPVYFRTKYKKNQPLIIFLCGNKDILNKGGLAVVGSRSADKKSLEYAYKAGMKAAESNVNIISGGASGIDSYAVNGALENGGQAIIIIPSDLSSSVMKKKYRDYILSNTLTIISFDPPNASWSPGRAMARNKFIYLLANAALVVQCDNAKGGTWSGAIENIKNSWTSLFVREKYEDAEGNKALLEMGTLTDSMIDITKLSKDSGPEIDYSLLTLLEISIIEKIKIPSVKKMLTTKKMCCLDYPLKEKSTKEPSIGKKQIDLGL